MSGRGMKWAGAILYTSLLIGVTVYIFQLDGPDERDKASSLISAFIALLGVPPVVAGMWHLWRGQGRSSPPSLDDAAGQLAEAVRNQWDAEAALRRVNDPYPLPVTWRAADDDLAEPWPQLTELANAWPGGPPGDPALWPQRAADLADEDVRIGEMFTDRVPTRRLVILGEPGAGKSVLLMRLLQDLLVSRTDDDPVPVIFSLASWNPEQPLKEWMADQLRRTHPGLRSPAPPTTTAGDTGDLARALVETRRILPLLDGFDELPGGLHGRALDSLNRALPARQPVVLAARAAEYRAALRGPGPTVRLNGAAAIQLLPLDPGKAADYLQRDSGGPPGAARWDAVAAELGTDSPVGQALSTPLGLFLARTIYNLRPDHTPGAEAPDPDELCNVQDFPDRAAVDQHLFRSFIPAAYAPDAHHPPRWNAEQAHRTFVTLARFLENQRSGSPDLAWWEVGQAAPQFIHGLIRGLGVGLASGLGAALVVGPVPGLEAGLAFGLVSGFRDRIDRFLSWFLVAGLGTAPRLHYELFLLKIGLVSGLVPGLGAGLTFGLVFGFGVGFVVGLATGFGVGFVAQFALRFGNRYMFGLWWAGRGTAMPNTGLRLKPGALKIGLVSGLMFGLIVGPGVGLGLVTGPVAGLVGGLVFGLMFGLRPKVLDLTSSIAPVALLRSDRKTFIWRGLVFGLVTGLVVGLMFGPVFGLAFGFVLVLGLGSGASAWPYFVAARAWLAVRHKTPYRLMSFLQDAHRHRGVLRQVGPVYQFRHIDLQRHLAQHPRPGENSVMP